MLILKKTKRNKTKRTENQKHRQRDALEIKRCERRRNIRDQKGITVGFSSCAPLHNLRDKFE